MSKQLTLLRHGKTGYSGRYVGSLDVPLSEEGKAQIASLGSFFSDTSGKTVFCSPMLRCRQSFQILFKDKDCSLEVDEDLREIDFGRWEGQSFQEIAGADPLLVERWGSWSEDFCFPEGERIGDFIERIRRVGAAIKKSAHDELVIVAHGGVIRALLCYFLRLEPSSYLLFQVKKGTFCTLELFSEGAVLTGLNIGS